MDPRDILIRALQSRFGIEVRLTDKSARDRVRAKLYRTKTAMKLGDSISISTSRDEPDTTLWIVHRAKETRRTDTEGNDPSV